MAAEPPSTSDIDAAIAITRGLHSLQRRKMLMQCEADVERAKEIFRQRGLNFDDITNRKRR